MGNFYTNFVILNTDEEEVSSVIKQLKRSAYVTQSEKDVVLFDQACDEQDVEEIQFLGDTLSKELDAPVIASLNHDDDHLLLWLFAGEKGHSHYASIADAPRFAWNISRFRGGILTYPFALSVLAWPTFIFQVFRHILLHKILSLPSLSAGLGYNYLSKGETPPNSTIKKI